MKLYTEEQVNLAMRLMVEDRATFKQTLKLLTPIELPSDEEILKVALENTNNINEQILFNNGAIYVCKLIEEQILNQNK